MSAIMPEAVFQIVNGVALAGWLVLIAGVAIRSETLRRQIAGRFIPLILALGYSILLVTSWPGTEGGFTSLEEIAQLFGSPWLLLAGWVHYLAFDLFVGAWAAQDAAERGSPRFLLIPVLPAIFLAGPLGFALWLALRTIYQPRI